jgi:hypothetical protein
MANLAANVTRIGTYIGSTPFVLGTSVFAVGTTKVSSFNVSGSPVSWRNGSTFNNLSAGGNQDQLTSGTAFIVLPTSAITTDDSLFSFNAPIASGGSTNTNAFLF